MIINHINNSFFQLKKNKVNIVFDPWIGEMPDTSTWSYPNTSGNKSILNKINPELIYISHLHSDHYDEQVLKKYKNKKTKILIKKFPDQRLKKKILALGYKNILEVNSWTTVNYKNFEFTIIPCDQSNSAGIDSTIFYDLDSSILVYDKISKTCFYNNVDNPLKLKSIRRVRKIAEKKYNKIDIASIGPRSASEYPQCFLGINRKEEKRKIIKKCFKRTYDMLKEIRVKNLIPAGGSYCITGKFNSLQKYVAHPTKNEILKYFSKKKINIFDIDNYGQLLLSNNQIKINKNNINSNIPNKLRKRKYHYENVKNRFNLKNTFELAKKKYEFITKKIKIKKNFRIEIFAYENLKINNRQEIDKKSILIDKFTLTNNYKGKFYLLECHIDKRLLYTCMTDRSNWNMAIGGSSMMFFRKPNIFVPDISYSLNFLRI